MSMLYIFSNKNIGIIAYLINRKFLLNMLLKIPFFIFYIYFYFVDYIKSYSL